jgi:hypothetical protein
VKIFGLKKSNLLSESIEAPEAPEAAPVPVSVRRTRPQVAPDAEEAPEEAEEAPEAAAEESPAVQQAREYNEQYRAEYEAAVRSRNYEELKRVASKLKTVYSGVPGRKIITSSSRAETFTKLKNLIAKKTDF